MSGGMERYGVKRNEILLGEARMRENGGPTFEEREREIERESLTY